MRGALCCHEPGGNKAGTGPAGVATSRQRSRAFSCGCAHTSAMVRTWPGDRFAGSHGLGGTGHAHGDNLYVVSGVLAAASGSVLDRLILTATESVWQVHEAATAVDESDKKIMQEERELRWKPN